LKFKNHIIMKKFFYSEGENNFGPFSLEEIKNKGITKETLVWHEGLENWKPAKTIPELNTLFNIEQPPLFNNQDKSKEETFLINKFGIIANSRIIFFNNLGWSSTGTKIEVKPQDITSVQMHIKRSLIGLIITLPIPIIFIIFSLSCKIGLINCGYTEFYALLILSIPCSILAPLWLFGYPQIEITVLGAYKNKMTGFPWDKKHAEEYLEILRKKHSK
jgi:hypothetical protein